MEYLLRKYKTVITGLWIRYSAFSTANRAFIIDSLESGPTVIVAKNMDEILIFPDHIPEWVGFYLLDKL